MKWAAAVCLCIIANLAQATVDAWPALYDVSGVAAGDVLNVRSAPDASAPIIGALDPMATDVEVSTVNSAENWGRVNIGEQSGWVSLQFMERQPGHDRGEFPAITACYGTEPFWNLAVKGDDAAFSRMGQDVFTSSPLNRLTSHNRLDRFAFTSPQMSGVLLVEECGDGMSDRMFGLSIEFIVNPDGGAQHLSGCCTIAP